MSTEHVGITLVQSLSDWLAAGTTLRAVRGDAARGAGDPGEGLPRLEESATSLPGQIGYAVDADVGAMVAFPWGRAGVVVRNVRAAAFDPADGGEPLRLARQARVGIALTPGRPTAPTVSREPGSWTIAVDADLTRTVRPAGSWRTVAIGAERWMAGGRLGVRGGIRGSTTGAWRPVAAGGLSLVVRDHLIVEAQGTGGHRSGDRGWSVAGRATF